MKSTYELASKVVIWLGESGEHTDLAVTAIIRIAHPGASLASRRSWKSSHIDVRDVNLLSRHIQTLGQALAPIHVMWEAICTLFRRP